MLWLYAVWCFSAARKQWVNESWWPETEGRVESFVLISICCYEPLRVSISTTNNDSEPKETTAKHNIKIKLQGENNLFLGMNIIAMFCFAGKLFKSRHPDSMLRNIYNIEWVLMFIDLSLSSEKLALVFTGLYKTSRRALAGYPCIGWRHPSLLVCAGHWLSHWGEIQCQAGARSSCNSASRHNQNGKLFSEHKRAWDYSESSYNPSTLVLVKLFPQLRS